MCMKDIVIVGMGGFAREAKWIIDRINEVTQIWNFLGYIDKLSDKIGVIGDDEYIINMRSSLAVILAIGNPKIRKQLYMKYRKNKMITFPNLIDPSVKMSEMVCIGEGNIICAENILTVDIRMGCFNIINLGCTVGHDVRIGNFNTVNPGTNISGNVILNDFIEIGTGTKIVQGVSIERGVITGAGSVIISDIPAETTVVGVPARILKYHKKDKIDESGNYNS